MHYCASDAKESDERGCFHSQCDLNPQESKNTIAVNYELATPLEETQRHPYFKTDSHNTISFWLEFFCLYVVLFLWLQSLFHGMVGLYRREH